MHFSCFFVLLLGPASLAQEPEKQPFHVPAPKGWGKEAIKLPPAFARDVRWKGIEELRFAPDWLKAGSDNFFSYAMLFWLPEDEKIDAKTMERELLAYYRGLAKAVLGNRKKDVDVSKFTLTVKKAEEKAIKRPGGETVTAYVGELKWIEPFTTMQSQTLRFEIQTWEAPKHKRHCVFICASPQPEKAAVWKALRDLRVGVTHPGP